MTHDNVIDGSILAYQVGGGMNGAYVTVAGNGETPVILRFDAEDLAALRRMLAEVAS